MSRRLWINGRKSFLGWLVCGIVLFAAVVIGLGIVREWTSAPSQISPEEEADELPGPISEPDAIVLPDLTDQKPIDRNRPILMARLGYGGMYSVANALVFSRDGRWLFIAGFDGTVGMWDFQSGREIRAFERMPECIRSLALSSDDKKLVVVGDTEVRILDVATRRRIPTAWDKFTYNWSVSLSADDKRIVIATENDVRVWDLATGKEVRTFKGLGRPFAACLSHDGKLLVTSASKWNDRSIETTAVKLWNVDSGEELRTFRGHQARVGSLTLSSDDQWLITTSDDKSARLWDFATGQKIRAFQGHTKYVTGCVLSSDKKRLVTRGYDKICVWDVETGKALSDLPDQTFTLALTPDGKQLASGTLPCTRVWDLATEKEIRKFQRLANYANFRSLSNDGKRLAVGEVGYWDLPAGKYVSTLAPKVDENTEFYRTDDGKWILTSDDGSAHLWDTATGKKVRSLAWKKQRFLNLSSDAKWLVSWDKNNTLHLWDLDAGKEIRTFQGRPTEGGNCITKVTLSSDKRWLVSEDFLACTTKLWDLSTGKEVLSVHNKRWWVPTSALSADSRWLAVSQGKIVKLWDLATLKHVRTFQGHANHVVSVSFSGDGQWMITRGAHWGRIIDDGHISRSTDKDITYRIWEVASGKTVAAFRHPPWTFSVTLTHDGKRLITGDLDGTARVRELPSGKELCRLVNFVDGTWAVYDAEARYDASNKDGIDGFYWVLGDEVFPLRRFRDSYYDPGLLAKYLGYNSNQLIRPQHTP